MLAVQSSGMEPNAGDQRESQPASKIPLPTPAFPLQPSNILRSPQGWRAATQGLEANETAALMVPTARSRPAGCSASQSFGRTRQHAKLSFCLVFVDASCKKQQHVCGMMIEQTSQDHAREDANDQQGPLHHSLLSCFAASLIEHVLPICVRISNQAHLQGCVSPQAPENSEVLESQAT